MHVCERVSWQSAQLIDFELLLQLHFKAIRRFSTMIFNAYFVDVCTKSNELRVKSHGRKSDEKRPLKL